MTYIEVPVGEGGQVVVIEVETSSGATPVSALGDRSRQAIEVLESSIKSIEDFSARLTAKLFEHALHRPDEIEVTFGIKISAELKAAVVAKTSGEAQYSIKLKWTKPSAASNEQFDS